MRHPTIRSLALLGTLLTSLATVAWAADPATLDLPVVRAEIGTRVQSLSDAVTTRDAVIGDLRSRSDSFEKKSTDLEAIVLDLRAANAELVARLAAVPAPVPTPAPTPTPVPAPTASYREMALGERITVAGYAWSAQTPRVLQGSDGSFRFPAKAGENANFDPPRKIRTEMVGLTQFAKGEPITLKGTFTLSADSVLTGTEWCSIVQIHQADTRRADGVPVSASPMFSMDVLPDPKSGKPFLQVRGETGRGLQPTFSPMRILGKLPDVALGVPHTFELRVIDGHGSTGRITVLVDGVTIVDRSDIATGYEYVDLLADAYKIRGVSQPATSYLKAGIYAGKGSGAVPPSGFTTTLTLGGLARP